MKGLIPLAVGCVEQVAALTVVTLSDLKKLDFENIRCAGGFQEPIEEEQSLITRPARDIQMEGFTHMCLMLLSRAPSHGPIPKVHAHEIDRQHGIDAQVDFIAESGTEVLVTVCFGNFQDCQISTYFDQGGRHQDFADPVMDTVSIKVLKMNMTVASNRN